MRLYLPAKLPQTGFLQGTYAYLTATALIDLEAAHQTALARLHSKTMPASKCGFPNSPVDRSGNPDDKAMFSRARARDGIDNLNLERHVGAEIRAYS